MHRKNELGLILSISLIAIMATGVFTAIPMVNAAPYTTFQNYGPGIDQLLFKMYATQTIEFEELNLGRIDVVDWPLSKYYIDLWTGNPEINMQYYGGDIGMREFDINLNATVHQCTATGPNEAAGDFPNIGTVFEFRHAVAHLVDRAYIITSVLQGFGAPQYTFVPAALGGWVNTGAEKHMYSPTEAAAILAAGDIHDTDGDGHLDWPGTPDGSSHEIIVDFCLRIDDTPGRYEAGLALIAALQTIGFHVNTWNANGSVQARQWWMAGKCAVIYTGGWSLSRDPDFLFDLFHISQYWHPGRPPNVAHMDDPELMGYIEGVKYAENAAMAMPNCQEAQRVMADKCLVIPAWSASAPIASRTKYTGGTGGVLQTPDDGENQYRGKNWEGLANEAGNGLNSYYTDMGAHVKDAGVPKLGGVLRQGFKVTELNQLNPVYSEWVWDWYVMQEVYDAFYNINPYDLSEDLESIAKRWEVGIWTIDDGPNAGQPGTKLIFEMRDDVYWNDGQIVDADDVVFTMQDLVLGLEARALPYPWYYANIMDVHDVNKLGQFKLEVRMNVKSFFAFHWIGGNIILPEHIWAPIVASGDPESFSPDPQLIGNGPFQAYPHSIRLGDDDYYVPSQYCKLDKNTNYFAGVPVKATSHVGAKDGAPKLVLTFQDYCPYTMDLEVTATVTGYSDAAKTTVVWGPNVYIYAWTGLTPPAGFPGSGHNVGEEPTVRQGLVDLTGVPKGTYLKVQLAMTMKVGGVTVWTKTVTLDPQARGYTVPGDVTNDGAVNVLDAIHLSFHFGLKAYVWPEDDLNLDNAINVQDALVLIANWGAVPPP